MARRAVFVLAALLFLLVRPAQAQITLVQSSGLFGTPAGTTANSLALPSNPAAGNSILVMVWVWTEYTAPTVNIVDSAGNTYSTAAQSTIMQVYNSGRTSINWYESASIFWTSVNATGANFKVTISLPNNDSASQIRGVVMEYSGIGSLDKAGVATGTSATATISTSGATAASNELVVSSLGIDNPASLFSSITPTSGFTVRAVENQNNGDTAGAAADRISSSAGVQSITWTTSPSMSGWVGAIASFAPSGAPGSGTAAGLNVVDGYLSSYPAAASGQKIYTKLAATPFTLNVAALNNVTPTPGLATPAYVSGTNKVTVDLVDDSDGACAASCGAVNCQSKAAVASQTTSLVSGDSSYKQGLSFTVASAYQNLRARAKDTSGSRTVFGCSVDNFSVRPSALTISSSASADASGASTSATPVIKAGNSFTLTATGVAGYGGTPGVNVAAIAANPSTVGTLSGSFGAANAATGAASGNFAYSEVGYFSLGAGAVNDTSFTAVDQASDCTADYSNVLVAGKYGCYFQNAAATSYFGRFVPDHFAVSPGSVSPGCGSFTYYDQDGFVTTFTLTAQNAANATTRNYSAAWARLPLTAWAGFGFSGDTATPSASATAPSGSWSNGSASVSAKHQVVARPTSTPAAPVSLKVSARPVDPDAVTTTAATSVMAAATPIRFGVLALGSAYGSNLQALSVPVSALYWNGTGLVANTADTCTGAALSNANVALGNLVQRPGSAGTFSTSVKSSPALGATWVNGAGAITLAASGAPGTAQLALNLGSASTDNSCIGWGLTSTGARLPWLRGNWCGSGFSSDPSSLASFGPSPTPFVMFRENH
jgi:hypothetical protein